jgi:hypothetical protein
MKQYLIIAITLLLPHVATAANLVVNGSFEDPVQQNNTFTIRNGITGWGLVSGSGIEVRTNNAGTASDGENFVELDARGNSAMEQIIQTSAGSLYELMFDYSPRIGLPDSTNGISVFWNDVLLSNMTATGGSANLWVTHQFFVPGTGGQDKLKFEATGTSDRVGGNIDNVRLDINEVPIPAALWLMVSALGLLGIVPKRKSA